MLHVINRQPRLRETVLQLSTQKIFLGEERGFWNMLWARINWIPGNCGTLGPPYALPKRYKCDQWTTEHNNSKVWHTYIHNIRIASSKYITRHRCNISPPPPNAKHYFKFPVLLLHTFMDTSSRVEPNMIQHPLAALTVEFLPESRAEGFPYSFRATTTPDSVQLPWPQTVNY